MNTTRSTCPYCGVGCGVLIDTVDTPAADGRLRPVIVNVRGDPDHPANFGRLCTKGSTLHLTAADHLAAQTRLLQPMRRVGAKPGAGNPLILGPAASSPLAQGAGQRTALDAFAPLKWGDALELAADRLADIHRQYGADAIGVYISGQLLTEDYYVFNKLVKGVLGTNQIDTNSRLCMSSAVSGYKLSLGADAPPCCYDDLACADTVFIAGSNMAWAHPVLFRRLEDAKAAKPEQKWIVVDPRRTETAALADLHLQIQPGTDVALFHGMLHLMLWEGWADTRFIAEHTQGFEALRQRVRDCTPAWASRITGIRDDDLLTAARWFARSPATLSLYCQGLNQSTSGTAKNQALINLHLACGQIGKAGAGPFSLTGQPNAMGGREVGGLATQLVAHRDLHNPEHRAEIERLWGLDSLGAKLHDKPGRTAVEMFQAAADGEVKALWIACTNPAQSLPDQTMVRRALERAEFVIVQEAFATTATVPYADLLLPAATWGEKDGTVTNSERRISRVRAAVAPAGLARADWQIAASLGRRLAARVAPERIGLLRWPDVQAVWDEHRATTVGRDLDIDGLSYAMLDAQGSQQWPVLPGAKSGTARLYQDHRFATADGKARFADVAYQAVAQPRSARYPLSLTTGRLRDQWHGMSRTGQLGRLFGHVAEPSVGLHPADMARLGVTQGALVRLRSAQGEVVLPAHADDSVAQTQAWLPMHWGEEVLLTSVGGVNSLPATSVCPISRQPEFKHTAVRIDKQAYAWRLTAMAWMPAAEVLSARERIKDLMRKELTAQSYVAVHVFGREAPASDGVLPSQSTGLKLVMAASVKPSDAMLTAVYALFGLQGAGALAYHDRQRDSLRLIRLGTLADTHKTVDAFSVAGAGHRERLDAWLSEQLRDRIAWRFRAQDLLAPEPWSLAEQSGASANSALNPQICTCFDVRRQQVDDYLASCQGDSAQRLLGLQQSLRCGTNCGSCLPALRDRVKMGGNTAPAFSSNLSLSSH